MTMFDEPEVTPGGTWVVPLGWTADNESTCRSCRAEVLWCVTPAGKKAPVNRDGTSATSRPARRPPTGGGARDRVRAGRSTRPRRAAAARVLPRVAARRAPARARDGSWQSQRPLDFPSGSSAGLNARRADQDEAEVSLTVVQAEEIRRLHAGAVRRARSARSSACRSGPSTRSSRPPRGPPLTPREQAELDAQQGWRAACMDDFEWAEWIGRGTPRHARPGRGRAPVRRLPARLRRRHARPGAMQRHPGWGRRGSGRTGGGGDRGTRHTRASPDPGIRIAVARGARARCEKADVCSLRPLVEALTAAARPGARRSMAASASSSPAPSRAARSSRTGSGRPTPASSRASRSGRSAPRAEQRIAPRRRPPGP
jgi:hypothetical protein